MKPPLSRGAGVPARQGALEPGWFGRTPSTVKVPDSEAIADVRSYICRTDQSRNFHFVFVETRGGLVGIGECSQSDQELAVQSNVELLGAALVGSSVFELTERLVTWLASGRSGRAWSIAISGIEMALWDLQGKVLSRPAFQLWGGGCHEAVRCYATASAGLRPEHPDEVLDECERCVEEGFRAIKVVPFTSLRGASLADHATRVGIESGMELLQTIRSRYPEVDLAVECGFAFSEHLGKVLLGRLADLGILWLEAPLWWDAPSALARLRQFSPVAIASGEVHHGKAAFRDLIELEAVDVLQPDVKWCGGCSELRKISAWADAHQIVVAPHNNSGPVATAASAHVAASLTNLGLLEVSSRLGSWSPGSDFIAPLPSQGAIALEVLRSRPGLGVDLSESAIRQLAREG